MTTRTKTRDLAEDLHARIARGELLQAFDELYADDIVMQENLTEPVIGHEANRLREVAFLEGIAEVQSYDVHAIAVHEDVSFVESTFRFRDHAGDDVTMTQVARSRWRDGKIVEERFYHG